MFTKLMVSLILTTTLTFASLANATLITEDSDIFSNDDYGLTASDSFQMVFISYLIDDNTSQVRVEIPGFVENQTGYWASVFSQVNNISTVVSDLYTGSNTFFTNSFFSYDNTGFFTRDISISGDYDNGTVDGSNYSVMFEGIANVDSELFLMDYSIDSTWNGSTGKTKVTAMSREFSQTSTPGNGGSVSVPEPSTLSLFAMLGVAGLVKRKKKQIKAEFI